jgi:hypothetical protein
LHEKYTLPTRQAQVMAMPVDTPHPTLVSFLIQDREDYLNDSASHQDSSTLAQIEVSKQNIHNKTILSIVFILFIGCAASAAFLGISITSAKSNQQFNHRARALVTEIEASWGDYENAGLWIHEACHYRNITRQEFRELYEYIRSAGLDFQAAEFIPNITNAERVAVETE